MIVNFGPFLESDMVGYIAPYMEPPISPSTIMDSTTEGARPTVVEAAEGQGRLSGRPSPEM